MTSTHACPPVLTSHVAEAVAAIREQGMRVTSARRLLIEALFDAEGPASADEIAEMMGTSDVASVYRNLDRLEAIGLVRHAHLGHGAGLYALAGTLVVGFIVCDLCGARREASEEELRPVRKAVRDSFGFEAGFAHFPIVGICADCQRARPQARRSALTVR